MEVHQLGRRRMRCFGSLIEQQHSIDEASHIEPRASKEGPSGIFYIFLVLEQKNDEGIGEKGRIEQKHGTCKEQIIDDAGGESGSQEWLMDNDCWSIISGCERNHSGI